jgi:anaerobic selenocysteine-containing dehydrogenase
VCIVWHPQPERTTRDVRALAMTTLRRREFLLTTSLAAGAVIFAGCVPPPREVEGESRVLLAEDLLSAYDNWYATTCRGCGAGCGVVVRIVDGRARKVEGNPDHPVNQGKLCARGQAIVQEQYHPDRLQGPLQRDPAQRGSGAFQSIGWQEALTTLSHKLQALQQAGRQQDVTLITPPLGAHQALLVQTFAQAYGLKWLQLEAISEAPFRAAAKTVFGTDQLPWFDVQHARTIVSFGADFLGTWLSPVRFGREYGIFRQGSYDIRNFAPRGNNQPRGRLIHIDSHFSTTAASADEWVWVRPGTEGMLALSMAQALGAAGFDAYAAEQTAQTTGVDAQRLRRIANELQNGQPSLVIGGGLAGAHTNGTESLTAILQLNVLLNNLDKHGGVLTQLPTSPLPELEAAAPGNPISDWQDLIARMNDGREQAVLVLGGANPVHGLPPALGMSDALRMVPFVASFASFGDDTATLADLVLPSSLPLEEWGSALPAPATPVSTLGMQQPVVEAIFDTRSAWDVLLSVAAALQLNLPWQTFKDLVQSSVDALRPQGVDQATFWSQLLQHGIYTNGSTHPPAPSLPQAGGENLRNQLEVPQFAGDATEYPLNLVPFVHNTLGAGEAAHLPWLQAAPDPVTSVTWQTWVEVNPQLADKMQLQEGDIVAVESPRGRVEVPAYINPAAAPEVLAMPLGQGHTGFGRWANRRGTNPLQLLEPLADQATGALAYAATRVKLSKTQKQMPMPKLEGIAPARQLPDKSVLEVLHQ